MDCGGDFALRRLSCCGGHQGGIGSAGPTTARRGLGAPPAEPAGAESTAGTALGCPVLTAGLSSGTRSKVVVVVFLKNPFFISIATTTKRWIAFL